MFKATRLLYRRGKITAAGVRDAVVRGIITAAQYAEITGAEYTTGDPEV